MSWFVKKWARRVEVCSATGNVLKLLEVRALCHRWVATCLKSEENAFYNVMGCDWANKRSIVAIEVSASPVDEFMRSMFWFPQKRQCTCRPSLTWPTAAWVRRWASLISPPESKAFPSAPKTQKDTGDLLQKEWEALVFCVSLLWNCTKLVACFSGYDGLNSVFMFVHQGNGGEKSLPGCNGGSRNGWAESAWMHGDHDCSYWTHAKEQHNPQNGTGQWHQEE